MLPSFGHIRMKGTFDDELWLKISHNSISTVRMLVEPSSGERTRFDLPHDGQRRTTIARRRNSHTHVVVVDAATAAAAAAAAFIAARHSWHRTATPLTRHFHLMSASPV